MSTRSPWRRAALALLVPALLLTSCGTKAAAPDDTADAANNIRIVSLSPTATEMLYAIGAGDQVVAVDSLSTYPAEVAPKVTKISAYEPSAEAILAYEPDVVVISNDMGGIKAQLEGASSKKITVWTGAAAASLDDVYAQITELGDLTGRTTTATNVIEEMKKRIAKAVDGVSAPSGSSYFYELDNTYYTVTSRTFVGALLAPLGIANIADGAENGNDYPQLSAEKIVQANPSVVFLADTKCCGQDAAKVAARPGWSDLDAVKNGNVVELDDDVASRWGPRVADLVEQMAAAVAKLNN